MAAVNPISFTIVVTTIVTKLTLDRDVVDVLMRDLAGHDRSPSAFLVYLHLAAQKSPLKLSHQQMAESIGLSKSAVQNAIRLLTKRKLLRMHKDSATAIPEYKVLRPWRR